MSKNASVVVPSIEGGEGLVRLADELLADDGPEVEVIVADNGLDTATVASLRSGRAQVVAMDGNRGFAAAVNRAAATASGDALVVVNDDIVPERGFLAAMTAPIERGEAMAAGVLLEAEDPGVIETAGVEIDAVLSGYDYLHGEPTSILERPVPPPLGPCGGAAAYDRAVFMDAGGFDEQFFAYCEDVDLAVRLRRAGLGCALAPNARARHHTSSTLGYGSLRKSILVGESRGRLWRKYGTMRHPGMALRVIAVESAASTALAWRHRSLAPAHSRVRGFLAAKITDTMPLAAFATVGFRDGLKRRSSRNPGSRMRAS